MRALRDLQFAALAGVAACTTGHRAASTPPAQLAASCERLVAAAPATWPELVPATLALGDAAVEPLGAALRRSPDGQGAQAAIAVLGALGGATACTTLRALLHAPTTTATEAALALAACAAREVRADLLAIAHDRLADATLRAACAATLVRLGAGQEVRALIRAIVLADTPEGRSAQQSVGLPTKDRWAHERWLLDAALRQLGGDALAVDPDAPWRELARAADAIDAWFDARR